MITFNQIEDSLETLENLGFKERKVFKYESIQNTSAEKIFSEIFKSESEQNFSSIVYLHSQLSTHRYWL